MGFVRLEEGKYVFFIEEGPWGTDREAAPPDKQWKERLDKTSNRTYYVNQATDERKWSLEAEPGKDKKKSTKKASAKKGVGETSNKTEGAEEAAEGGGDGKTTVKPKAAAKSKTTGKKKKSAASASSGGAATADPQGGVEETQERSDGEDDDGDGPKADGRALRQTTSSSPAAGAVTSLMMYQDSSQLGGEETNAEDPQDDAANREEDGSVDLFGGFGLATRTGGSGAAASSSLLTTGTAVAKKPAKKTASTVKKKPKGSSEPTSGALVDSMVEGATPSTAEQTTKATKKKGTVKKGKKGNTTASAAAATTTAAGEGGAVLADPVEKEEEPDEDDDDEAVNNNEEDRFLGDERNQTESTPAVAASSSRSMWDAFEADIVPSSRTTATAERAAQPSTTAAADVPALAPPPLPIKVPIDPFSRPPPLPAPPHYIATPTTTTSSSNPHEHEEQSSSPLSRYTTIDGTNNATTQERPFSYASEGLSALSPTPRQLRTAESAMPVVSYSPDSPVQNATSPLASASSQFEERSPLAATSTYRLLTPPDPLDEMLAREEKQSWRVPMEPTQRPQLHSAAFVPPSAPPIVPRHGLDLDEDIPVRTAQQLLQPPRPVASPSSASSQPSFHHTAMQQEHAPWNSPSHPPTTAISVDRRSTASAGRRAKEEEADNNYIDDNDDDDDEASWAAASRVALQSPPPPPSQRLTEPTVSSSALAILRAVAEDDVAAASRNRGVLPSRATAGSPRSPTTVQRSGLATTVTAAPVHEHPPQPQQQPFPFLKRGDRSRSPQRSSPPNRPKAKPAWRNLVSSSAATPAPPVEGASTYHPASLEIMRHRRTSSPPPPVAPNHKPSTRNSSRSNSAQPVAVAAPVVVPRERSVTPPKHGQRPSLSLSPSDAPLDVLHASFVGNPPTPTASSRPFPPQQGTSLSSPPPHSWTEQPQQPYRAASPPPMASFSTLVRDFADFVDSVRAVRHHQHGGHQQTVGLVSAHGSTTMQAMSSPSPPTPHFAAPQTVSTASQTPPTPHSHLSSNNRPVRSTLSEAAERRPTSKNARSFQTEEDIALRRATGASLLQSYVLPRRTAHEHYARPKALPSAPLSPSRLQFLTPQEQATYAKLWNDLRRVDQRLNDVREECSRWDAEQQRSHSPDRRRQPSPPVRSTKGKAVSNSSSSLEESHRNKDDNEFSATLASVKSRMRLREAEHRRLQEAKWQHFVMRLDQGEVKRL